jgi:hypothetical protein
MSAYQIVEPIVKWRVALLKLGDRVCGYLYLSGGFLVTSLCKFIPASFVRFCILLHLCVFSISPFVWLQLL